MSTWKEFRKELNITEEEEKVIEMEKDAHSPQIDSLLRVLAPLGYTLQIVPMKKV